MDINSEANRMELFKEKAERHWEYTEGIIKRCLTTDPEENTLELMKYLYIKSMLHGYKHGLEEGCDC